MNDEAASRKSSQHEDASRRSNGLILLVEDNADEAELTLRAFRHKGFRNPIVTVKDGVQALDYLKRRGTFASVQDPQPSLILLDVKLPLVNGLEVLEKIKTDPDLKSLPVVMLTSSRHDRDVSAAYKLGANSYVRKPTEYNNFLEVVSKLGNYWFGIVESAPEHTPPGAQLSY